MKHLLLLFSLLISFVFSSHAQLITCVAGNGIDTFKGDGGQATAAGITVSSVCIDPLGNIYLASDNRCHVRKVSPSGIITSIAGNSISGYSGDGGPASAAEFNAIRDLAADRFGNIFIADGLNLRIRRVDASGIVTTYAGTGLPGPVTPTGDGGPATNARLMNVNGIATDTAGNLYITDLGRIRKVNRAGIITTIAGYGTSGDAGDGGPATAAEINALSVRTDTSGNIYVNHLYSVRKIDAAGIITTVAGDGTSGYSGDGGPATAAQINIKCAAPDNRGNVYISDVNRIRKIDAAGIISTVAGDGTGAYRGDNDPCAATTIACSALRLAVDKYNNVYITDGGHYRLRKLSDNRLPAFADGINLTLNACKDGATINADTLLAVTDGEPGQTEIWSLVTPAVHGTAVVSYTGIYSGGTLTPTGMSYTPAVGYIGIDSFTVRVKDCIDSATTAKVYVTISDCKVASPQPSPKERGLSVYPNPAGDVIHVRGVSSPVTYRLVNVIGSVLLSGNLDNVSNVVKLGNVASGVYMLEVDLSPTLSRGEGGVAKHVYKIIKQ